MIHWERQSRNTRSNESINWLFKYILNTIRMSTYRYTPGSGLCSLGVQIKNPGPPGPPGPTGLQGSPGNTGPTGPATPVTHYVSSGGTGYLMVNGGTNGFTGNHYSEAIILGPSIVTDFGKGATASSDPTIYVNADIIPTQSGVFNLGSRSKPFKSMNVAAQTIYVGSSFMSTDSAGNILLTSTDGTSAVPSTNENFMVAVGSDTTSSIKYSTNGTTWLNAVTGLSGPTGSSPPFLTGNTVVWTGNIWVAGGQASSDIGSSSILKSNNGKEWFVPAITTDPFSQFGQGVGQCLSIAYNASQAILIAVGTQGNDAYTNNFNHMFYSLDDGNTWIPVNYTPNFPPGGTTSLYASKVATDGGNRWFIIDTYDNYGDNAVLTSTDGINFYQSANIGIYVPSSLRYNGHYWLACGGGFNGFFYSIVKSTDGGNSWNGVLSNLPNGTAFFATDVAWNGIYWVCVGNGDASNLWTSQDGDNWTNVAGFEGVSFTTVTWNGEVWVAGGKFPDAYDINGNLIPNPVSFIVSYDTINWYSVSGSPFSRNPLASASRRVLPFGGPPPGTAGSAGSTGPTGPQGPAFTNWTPSSGDIKVVGPTTITKTGGTSQAYIISAESFPTPTQGSYIEITAPTLGESGAEIQLGFALLMNAFVVDLSYPNVLTIVYYSGMTNIQFNGTFTPGDILAAYSDGVNFYATQNGSVIATSPIGLTGPIYGAMSMATPTQDLTVNNLLFYPTGTAGYSFTRWTSGSPNLKIISPTAFTMTGGATASSVSSVQSFPTPTQGSYLEIVAPTLAESGAEIQEILNINKNTYYIDLTYPNVLNVYDQNGNTAYTGTFTAGDILADYMDGVNFNAIQNGSTIATFPIGNTGPVSAEILMVAPTQTLTVNNVLFYPTGSSAPRGTVIFYGYGGPTGSTAYIPPGPTGFGPTGYTTLSRDFYFDRNSQTLYFYGDLLGM